MTSEIAKRLPTHIFEFFMESQQRKYTNTINSNSSRLNKKFRQSLDRHQEHLYQENPDFWIEEKCFHNLTNIEVPDMSRILFCLEPQFALPVDNNNIPLLRLLADVDYSTSYLCNEDTKDTINTNVSENIHQFLKGKKRNQSKIDTFLQKALVDTKVFLKNNKDIYVTNSDKSNMTVLLPKSTYEEKMALLLSDNTTYEKLEMD